MWIRGVGEHARSRRRWIRILKQMQVTSLCSLFLSVDANTRSALRLGAVLFRIVYYIPLSILELWSAIRWRSACSDPCPTRVRGSVCLRIRRPRSGWRKIAIRQQPSGQPGREPCCVNAYMRMLF